VFSLRELLSGAELIVSFTYSGKNFSGTGEGEDMVVMSIEDYEDQKFRAEINAKLAEAEIEASATTIRYSRYEAMKLLKARLNANPPPHEREFQEIFSNLMMKLNGPQV
jgi:hypothetical protein